MKRVMFCIIAIGVLYGGCPPKQIHRKPDKVLSKNGWTLKIWITAKGTRSQGYVSHLYYKGKEICPKNWLITPFGKLQYKDSKYPWGWHGWELKGVNFNQNYSNSSELDEFASGFSIAGKWNTSFGNLVLRVNKNGGVSGSYTHDKGELTGKLKGRVLYCKWSEAPSYAPPKDAGECRFVFSKDGKSFKGKWRYGFGGKSWNGNWTGYKVSSKGFK